MLLEREDVNPKRQLPNMAGRCSRYYCRYGDRRANLVKIVLNRVSIPYGTKLTPNIPLSWVAGHRYEGLKGRFGIESVNPCHTDAGNDQTLLVLWLATIRAHGVAGITSSRSPLPQPNSVGIRSSSDYLGAPQVPASSLGNWRPS